MTDDEIVNAMLEGYMQDHRNSAHDGGPLQHLDSAISLIEKEKAGPRPKPTVPTLDNTVAAMPAIAEPPVIPPESLSVRRRKKKLSRSTAATPTASPSKTPVPQADLEDYPSPSMWSASREEIDHSYSPPDTGPYKDERSECEPADDLVAKLLCFSTRIPEEPDPFRFMTGHQSLLSLQEHSRVRESASTVNAIEQTRKSEASARASTSSISLQDFAPTIISNSRPDSYNQSLDRALEVSYNALGMLSMLSSDRQTPISVQVRQALRFVNEQTRERHIQHLWTMGLRGL
jgi:hypothetical protein